MTQSHERAPSPAPASTASGPAIVSEIEILPATADDLDAMSRLHARAFGPGRFARTAYRIREAHPGLPLSPHCRIARDAQGGLAGAVTMTPITLDTAPGHWLLGPLAIRPDLAGRSIGRALVRAALASLTQTGSPEATVILVGDLKYYGPLGFSPLPPGTVRLPGPADPARLLVWLGPDGDRAPPRGLVRAA